VSVAQELAPKLYTAEELLRLDREGCRHELFRGELREMPLPGAEHGNLAERLGSRASVFVDDHDLGQCFTAETGFLLERDPDTVRGADWAFVRKERLPERLPQGYLSLAPDIALEVRSPSSREAEVAEKLRFWLEKGTRIVWDLDPAARTVTVHRPGEPPRTLGADDVLTGEEVLPGFSLPVGRIFRASAAERPEGGGK
jgi:Uma2 family endonuclease